MEMEKEFLSKIQKIYGKANREVIEKAFKFAEKKHKGQMRDSGEEFIVHPYNVAKILVGMQADVDSVVSGLLHDVLPDAREVRHTHQHQALLRTLQDQATHRTA